MYGLQTGFDYTRSEEYLHRLDHMKNSLLHRGPDNNDLFLSAHAGLAHTRLSIIDLAGGRQPMKKSFSYKTAIISYNGEIYNGKELKNYLRKYGNHSERLSCRRHCLSRKTERHLCIRHL